MARFSSITPVRDVLRGLIRGLKAEGRPSLELVAETWARLVGEEAAKASWPKRLTQGRLIVEVENSGWMYALNLKKDQLLEGLIELLGINRVESLSFRVGERTDA